MSKVDALPLAGASLQYRDWLSHERRARLTVRGTQLAVLLVFLVLWEVLPRAQLVNPMFTSYPSALWPTFLELLPDTECAVRHIHVRYAEVRERIDDRVAEARNAADVR